MEQDTNILVNTSVTHQIEANGFVERNNQQANNIRGELLSNMSHQLESQTVEAAGVISESLLSSEKRSTGANGNNNNNLKMSQPYDHFREGSTASHQLPITTIAQHFHFVSPTSAGLQSKMSKQSHRPGQANTLLQGQSIQKGMPVSSLVGTPTSNIQQLPSAATNQQNIYQPGSPYQGTQLQTLNQHVSASQPLYANKGILQTVPGSPKCHDGTSDQLKNFLLSAQGQGRLESFANTPSSSLKSQCNSVDSSNLTSNLSQLQSNVSSGSFAPEALKNMPRPVFESKTVQLGQKQPRKKKSKTPSVPKLTSKALIAMGDNYDDDDNDFIPVGMVQLSTVRRSADEETGSNQQQTSFSSHQTPYLQQPHRQTTENTGHHHLQQNIKSDQGSFSILSQHGSQLASRQPEVKKSTMDTTQQHKLLLQLVHQAQQQKQLLEQQQRQQLLCQQQERHPQELYQTHSEPRTTNLKMQEIKKNPGLIIRHLQQHLQGGFQHSDEQQNLSVTPSVNASNLDSSLSGLNSHHQTASSFQLPSPSSTSSSSSLSSSSLPLAPPTNFSTQPLTNLSQLPSRTMAQPQQQSTNIPKIAEQLLKSYHTLPDEKVNSLCPSQFSWSGNDQVVVSKQAPSIILPSQLEGSILERDQEIVEVERSTTKQHQFSNLTCTVSRATTPNSGQHSHHHPEISRMLCSPVSPRHSTSSPRASASPRRTESPMQSSVSPSHFVSPRKPASPHSSRGTHLSLNSSSGFLLTSKGNTNLATSQSSPNTTSGNKTYLHCHDSSPLPPSSPWQPISPSQASVSGSSPFTVVQKPYAMVGQAVNVESCSSSKPLEHNDQLIYHQTPGHSIQQFCQEGSDHKSTTSTGYQAASTGYQAASTGYQAASTNIQYVTRASPNNFQSHLELHAQTSDAATRRWPQTSYCQSSHLRNEVYNDAKEKTQTNLQETMPGGLGLVQPPISAPSVHNASPIWQQMCQTKEDEEQTQPDQDNPSFGIRRQSHQDLSKESRQEHLQAVMSHKNTFHTSSNSSNPIVNEKQLDDKNMQMQTDLISCDRIVSTAVCDVPGSSKSGDNDSEDVTSSKEEVKELIGDSEPKIPSNVEETENNKNAVNSDIVENVCETESNNIIDSKSDTPKREVRQRKPKKPFEQDETPSRRTNRNAQNQKVTPDVVSHKKQTTPSSVHASNSHKKSQPVRKYSTGNKKVEEQETKDSGKLVPEKSSARRSGKNDDEDYRLSASEESETETDPSLNEPRRLSRRIQVKKEEKLRLKSEASGDEESRSTSSNTRKSLRIATKVDYKEDGADPPEDASSGKSMRSSSRLQQKEMNQLKDNADKKDAKEAADKKAPAMADKKISVSQDTKIQHLKDHKNINELEIESKKGSPVNTNIDEKTPGSKVETKNQKLNEKTEENSMEDKDVVEKMATRSRNSRRDGIKEQSNSVESGKVDMDKKDDLIEERPLAEAGISSKEKPNGRNVIKTAAIASKSESSQPTPIGPDRVMRTRKRSKSRSRSPLTECSQPTPMGHDRVMRTRNRSKSRSRSPLTTGTLDVNTPITRRNMATRLGSEKEPTEKLKHAPVSEFVDELPITKKTRKGETSSVKLSQEKVEHTVEEKLDGTNLNDSVSGTLKSSQPPKQMRGRKGTKRSIADVNNKSLDSPKLEQETKVQSDLEKDSNLKEVSKEIGDTICDAAESNDMSSSNKTDVREPLPETPEELVKPSNSLNSQEMTKKESEQITVSHAHILKEDSTSLPQSSDSDMNVKSSNIEDSSVSAKQIPVSPKDEHEMSDNLSVTVGEKQEKQSSMSKQAPVSPAELAQKELHQVPQQSKMVVYKLVPVVCEDASYLQDLPLMPVSGYFVKGLGGDHIVLPQNLSHSQTCSPSTVAQVLESVVSHPLPPPPPPPPTSSTNQDKQLITSSHKPTKMLHMPVSAPPPYQSLTHSHKMFTSGSKITLDQNQLESGMPYPKITPPSPKLRTALQGLVQSPDSLSHQYQSSSSMWRSNQPTKSHQQFTTPLNHQQKQIESGYRQQPWGRTDEQSQSQQTQPLQSPPVQRNDNTSGMLEYEGIAPNQQIAPGQHQRLHKSQVPPPYRPSPSWNPMASPHHQTPPPPSSTSSSPWNPPSSPLPPKQQLHHFQNPEHQMVSSQLHLQSPPPQHQGSVSMQQQQQHKTSHLLNQQVPWTSPQYQMREEPSWGSQSANSRIPVGSSDTWDKGRIGEPTVAMLDRLSSRQQLNITSMASSDSLQPAVFDKVPETNNLFPTQRTSRQQQQHPQEPQNSVELNYVRTDQIIQNFFRSDGDDNGEDLAGFNMGQQDMADLERDLRLSPNAVLSAMAAACEEDGTDELNLHGVLLDGANSKKNVLPSSSQQRQTFAREGTSNNINLVHTVNLDLDDSMPGGVTNLDISRLSASLSGRSPGVNSSQFAGDGIDSFLGLDGRSRSRSLPGESTLLPGIKDSELDELLPLNENIINNEQKDKSGTSTDTVGVETSTADKNQEAKKPTRKDQYKVVTENGQSRYECLICNRTYAAATIYRHLRLHDPNHHVQCKICDKRYTQRSTLIAHMVRSHGYVHIPREYGTKKLQKNADEKTSVKDSGPMSPKNNSQMSPPGTSGTDKRRHSSGGKSSSSQDRSRQGQNSAEGKGRHRRSSSHSPSNPLNPGLDDSERVIHRALQTQVEGQRGFRAEQKRRKTAGEVSLSDTDFVFNEGMASIPTERENVGVRLDQTEKLSGQTDQNIADCESSGLSKKAEIDEVQQESSVIAQDNGSTSRDHQLTAIKDPTFAHGPSGSTMDMSNISKPSAAASSQCDQHAPGSEGSTSHLNLAQANIRGAHEKKTVTSSSKLDELISAVANGMAGDPSNIRLGGDPSNIRLGGDPSNIRLGGDPSNIRLGGDPSNIRLDFTKNSAEPEYTDGTDGNVIDASISEINGTKFEAKEDIFKPIVQTLEDGTKKYACQVCKRVMGAQRSFNLHIRRHREPKSKICTICMKGFHTNNELTNHMRSHTGEIPYKSKNLSDITKSSDEPERIVEHTDTDGKIMETTSVSQMTSSVSEEKEDIYEALVKTAKDGTTKYCCRLCKRVMANPNSFKLHIRRHKEPKTKICAVCEKGFHTDHELTNHMRSHTGERPYKCEICHLSFSHNGSSQTHKRSHKMRGETEPYPIIDGQVQYPKSFRMPRFSNKNDSEEPQPKRKKRSKSTCNSSGIPSQQHHHESGQRENVNHGFATNSSGLHATDQRINLNEQGISIAQNEGTQYYNAFNTAMVEEQGNVYGSVGPVQQKPVDVSMSNQESSYNQGNYYTENQFYGTSTDVGAYYSHQNHPQPPEYQVNSLAIYQHQDNDQAPDPPGYKRKLAEDIPHTNSVKNQFPSNFNSGSPSTEIVKSLLQHYNLPEQSSQPSVLQNTSKTSPHPQQQIGSSTAYQQGKADAQLALSTYEDVSMISSLTGQQLLNTLQNKNQQQQQLPKMHQPPQYQALPRDRSSTFFPTPQRIIQQQVLHQSPQHQLGQSPQHHQSPQHQILNQQSPQHQVINTPSPQYINAPSPLSVQSPQHVINTQSPQHHNLNLQQSPQHTTLSHQSPQQQLQQYNQRQTQQTLPPFASVLPSGSPQHHYQSYNVSSPSMPSPSSGYPQTSQQVHQNMQPLPKISSLARDAGRSVPKSE